MPEDSSGFLRQKGVAEWLGVDRHTVARIARTDPAFPRSIPISPGVRVWRRRDLEHWLKRCELAALMKRPHAPAR
jgi:predicted DNA-binding transcriptional regulator AlpA